MKIDRFKLIALSLLTLLLLGVSGVASADAITNGTFSRTAPTYSYVY